MSFTKLNVLNMIYVSPFNGHCIKCDSICVRASVHVRACVRARTCVTGLIWRSTSEVDV